MLKLKYFAIACAVAFSLSIMGCQGTSAQQANPQSASVEGARAPDFTLKDIDGNDVSLSDFKGKVVILAFFASWCPPCVMEVPHFVELQNQYKDKGFSVIGISVDYMDARGMKIFAKEHAINYPVLINDGKVAADYGPIASIPTTVIVDKNGLIAKRYIGYRDKEAFETDILELLNK